MTAELVVMNAYGVALAADSARTAGTGTSLSAEKIWQLPGDQPVALLKYGSTELLGVPWDALLARFFRDGGPHDRASLPERMTALIDFLSAQAGALFPAEEQRRHVRWQVNSMYLDVRERQRGVMKHAQEVGRRPRAAGGRFILGELERWRAAPHVKGLEGTGPAAAVAPYLPDIRQLRAACFNENGFDAKVWTALEQLAIERLTRQLGWGASGLVVAGYGAEDLLPGCVAVELQTVLADRVTYWKLPGSEQVDRHAPAVIRTFAQDDGAQSFLRGAHPDMSSFLAIEAGEMFTGLADHVVNQLAPGASSHQRQQMRERAQAMAGRLGEAFEQRSTEHHVDPIRRALRGVPAVDLAAFAEQMVELTALRKRVRAERLDVGGPVDVAVLTLANGLEWVRHKGHSRVWA